MFNLITSEEDLILLGKELSCRKNIAIDTEFRRTTKDNMRLALLQVNDEEEIYLIDTILIQNPGEHANFLFSESVTKILHSCKEDLEAIYSWTGKIMTNIFDTQLAHAFLDGHYSIGYQGLVEEKLEILLDKKETRSNWIRRPLSDSQLNYAASDVQYLLNLYREQVEELRSSDKIEWHNEEINFLSSSIFNPSNNNEELSSGISKKEERALLNKFNEIVVFVAEKEKINPTLFFSKKIQKEFLRSVLQKGPELACKDITCWRRLLIKDSLNKILT